MVARRTETRFGVPLASGAGGTPKLLTVTQRDRGEIGTVADALTAATIQLHKLIGSLDAIGDRLRESVDPAALVDDRDGDRPATTLREIELDLRTVRGQLINATLLVAPAENDLRHLHLRRTAPAPADDPAGDGER